MDDQLELHLQRFQEEENSNKVEEEDDDLQQLLTLQSSAASSAEKQQLTKSAGESSSSVEESQEQESNDDTESRCPQHLKDDLNCDEGRTAYPPTTNVTDQFMRMARLIESQEPHSYSEVAIKLLWVLPILVVLGDHVGWIWSLQWTILGIVILRIKPGNLMFGEVKHHDDSSGKATVHTPQLVTPSEMTQKNQWAQKKVIDETISKVSHLLGLVGAPPLLLPLEEDQTSNTNADIEDVVDETMENIQVEKNRTRDQSDSKPEEDISPALDSLIHLVESRVQFLLTVDQTLDYLRISASIHLGLGPQSQCVERVEQAAMARKLRQNRRKPNSDSTREENDTKAMKKRSLEPQRGTDRSVLSLVSLRRNLAMSMVQHSATLDAFWKLFYEHQERDSVDEGGFPAQEPLLEMPRIVNLAWIKDARRVLAESLSETAEEIILHLEASSRNGSQPPEPWRVCFWLEDADAQSRQLTHYLRGTLLLPYDKTEIKEPTSTMIRAVENPNDPLFKSLLNFRTQLDALGTALWSCQQYCNQSREENGTGDSDEGVQESPEVELRENAALAQKQWWMKIREMSEICRAFETEITEMYFPQEVLGESETDSHGENDNTQPATSQETGDYVHGDSKSKTQPIAITTKDETTKTLVFSGKGKVEDRPKKSGRKGKGRNRMDSEDLGSASALPQRDTVSELAMVSELQNRIKELKVDEEIEEVESDSEQEKAAKLARQPTAPLFLGASGSLLSELKLSIPAMGLQNPDFGNDAGEEIIGED